MVFFLKKNGFMRQVQLLLFFFLLWISVPLQGQYVLVNYDYELSTFNENKPLPSETQMIISGAIPDKVQMVEIRIYSHDGNENRAPFHTAAWKRPFNKPSGEFRVPINFRLRASKKYDLSLLYFKAIDTDEKERLFDQLLESLGAYIDQIILFDGKLKLEKKPGQALSDMDEIVTTGLSNYRSLSGQSFNGFSDLIRDQLAALPKKEFEKEDGNSVEKAVDQVKVLVMNEVSYLLNDSLVKVTDSRYVEDYETEKKSGYFSLNVGYGAVYLDGNIDNLDYGTAPYLSLGFPLSTSRLAPAFLRNSSLTLGLFLDDFENSEGKTISGPIVNRPIQVGLDFKLFQFVRFGAGVVILEEEGGSGGILERKVFLQPFIGIGAKINIQLALDK
jgi:hypothetical protein